MFERTHDSTRSRARDADALPPKPGASSLAEHDVAAKPGLFTGDETWEDLAPAAKPDVPDGDVGTRADEHRKTVRDYKLRRELTVTDLARRSRGRTNSRDGGAHADGKISVDIGTVVGSARNDYKSAYVLVWKGRKTKGPDTNSGDPTGWVRVGKLPKAAQRDIAALQDKKRKERGKHGGAGAKAKRTGQAFAVSPTNPQGITEQFIERGPGQSKLEAFRIKGGSVDDDGTPSSTPCGNYTLNPARYGDNIVGVWNPPGSKGSNGKANAGSGGIRAFIPTGKRLEICDVTPIVIPNFDTAVGTGTSTWVYVTCILNRERIYCWVLKSWTFTGADGKDRSGANG